MFPRSTLIVTVTLLAAGCTQHTATPPAASGALPSGSAAAIAASPPAPSVEPGIAWYSGSVESAFAAARAQNKPVFLYWGAQWCPPCHELKATVFSRPDFIEKLKLFIPVYLDGDDAGAQKWGDRFGVSGYPPYWCCVPIRVSWRGYPEAWIWRSTPRFWIRYWGDVRPVSTILAALKSGGARPLAHDDCHRLAYYGWDLTAEISARFAVLSQTLSQAAARCPADTEGGQSPTYSDRGQPGRGW